MFLKPCLGIILFAVLLAPALAEGDPELNPQHPESYVVVTGDTLWDISGKFLRFPWRWMELWRNNPQIENPNLIYPGDVIAVRLVDGKPVAEIVRGGAMTRVSPTGRGGTIKLSPSIRTSALAEAIPTIPLDAIQPFLSHTRVVTSADVLDHAAYVVGHSDHRLAAAAGDSIYVRGIATDTPIHYGIYRVGHPCNRPSDPPVLLGVEATFVGEAELKRLGDPATLLVTESVSEILSGDRLLPEQTLSFDRNFIPHAPEKPIEGHIIDILDGSPSVARLQAVVLDKGQEDGLGIGHVLMIYQSGDVATDPITHETINLPEEKAGLLMIFRVFDHVSYALILEAQKDMRILDTVRSPNYPTKDTR